MRIFNPFNIIPDRADFRGSHLFAKMNFLDIDATAKLLRDNGSVVMEIPFQFVSSENRFVAVKPLPIHFKWKEVSKIEIFISLYLEIRNPPYAIGNTSHKLLQVLNVNYGVKGTTLQAETMKPRKLGNNKKTSYDFDVSSELVIPEIEADLGSAKLILNLSLTFNDEGVGLSGGPVSTNTGSINYGYSKEYEFTLAYLVTNRPQEVIQLPEHLLSHDVFFENEDQPEISNLKLERLADHWVMPLREKAPRLAAAIETGICPIKLIGHASVTGRSKEYNLALSGKRIASVAEAIKKAFKTNKLVYVSIPLGVMVATQSGPADQERRVEIVIERDTARSILSKE